MGFWVSDLGFDFSLLKCFCGVIYVGSGVGKCLFFFFVVVHR